MEKKTQDLAWKCAPKEFRGIVRNMYERFCKPASLEYFEDARSLLKALYGHHNLTSDTEPEEMLHCSRDFVIGRYKHLTSSIAWNEGDVRAFQAETSLLKELFGDKCLPDKEVLTAKNVTESVIARPKTLNVGDKVKIIGSGTEAGKAKIGEIGEILDIDTQNNACFVLYRKGQDWVRACDLEPYTEESRNLSQETANCDKSTRITLSDEELDHIIFELIRIRDNRRENDRQLTEVLAKL